MPKKERFGKVVSNKMNNTVVVKVDHYRPHPKYKKIKANSKSYFAHDPENICQIGDEVKLIEIPPVSKNKCWRVAEVLQKAT